MKQKYDNDSAVKKSIDPQFIKINFKITIHLSTPL